MNDIRFSLQQVQSRLADACKAAGRETHSVRLLAVSKTQSAMIVAEAYAAGQRAFGENYVQEAIAKITTLAESCPEIEWHLIGPLQSNKTAEVAEHFAWVHSVDRLKIATRLSTQRPAHLPPLNICLQVNIDDEESKSGCQPSEIVSLVQQVIALPHLVLRGLMVIPRPDNIAAFAALAELRQQILKEIPALSPIQFDTLSMGMSADIEAAIAAGSTMVRVGTAIFGARQARQ